MMSSPRTSSPLSSTSSPLQRFQEQKQQQLLSGNDPFGRSVTESYYGEDPSTTATATSDAKDNTALVSDNVLDLAIYGIPKPTNPKRYGTFITTTAQPTRPFAVVSSSHGNNTSPGDSLVVEQQPSTFPSLPTSPFLSLPEPAPTPYNTPNPKSSKVVSEQADVDVPANKALQEEGITEAFKNASEVLGRPVNTGLRPLLLALPLATGHRRHHTTGLGLVGLGLPGLDGSVATSTDGPKSLALPQKVARRKTHITLDQAKAKRASAKVDDIIHKMSMAALVSTPKGPSSVLVDAPGPVTPMKRSTSLPSLLHSPSPSPLQKKASQKNVKKVRRQTELIEDILELLGGSDSTTNPSGEDDVFFQRSVSLSVSAQEGTTICPRSPQMEQILSLLSESSEEEDLSAIFNEGGLGGQGVEDVEEGRQVLDGDTLKCLNYAL